MKDKDKYDDIADYADKSLKKVLFEADNKCGMIVGNASYNLKDLIIVYKMERMRFLNLIDEKEYYKLMALYYKYLELKYELDEIEEYIYCDTLREGHTPLEDEDLLIKMNKKIKRIEIQLEDYELLEENVEFNELIDSQVRLLYMKKNK